jgi:plasmid stabilization system protein ParE
VIGALVTPEARADLRAIWEYIADDNIDAADRVLDQIEQAFNTLADMPGGGALSA